MEDSKLNVYKETARILRELDNTRENPGTKAIFANIRNSINKDSSVNMDALAYVFQNIPEEFLGYNKNLNDYEKSILTAVQMYALHQQAKVESVLKLDYKEGERRQNLGDSLNSMRKNNDEDKAIDRRFNAMITSSSFEELSHHLRQIIKLLKAKSEAKVDYASLADDLYWFLKNQREGLKIKWSRSYYKSNKKEGENNNAK
ncbi:type I-E CRISPR-associated protein Cse2/CasB [Anaerococcus degeneri]|uniref:Type I-E CRISPR-associated protein Cse2/CasB n=1 Tax=Anaerococcus degeneri TaxID=361500 RepID=A0ABS7Z1N7_9FIRM|nr:type I-E CRISPR-associated protein Cse2/CasB [Anaerococcus degeneri]MBP2016154.1 CRISPR system Cascade subunit CasB [Anaerococcus degeneri]MCA2096641.1 type I-E CRISPR-associated protein Cse2/CasB [Anaerococcus degeneri]